MVWRGFLSLALSVCVRAYMYAATPKTLFRRLFVDAFQVFRCDENECVHALYGMYTPSNTDSIAFRAVCFSLFYCCWYTYARIYPCLWIYLSLSCPLSPPKCVCVCLFIYAQICNFFLLSPSLCHILLSFSLCWDFHSRPDAVASLAWSAKLHIYL